MNDQDFNRLRSIIREEVELAIDTALVPIKKTLDEHSEKIDALAAELSDVHQQTGAIWDKVSLTYERNKREIDEIKDHLHLPKLPSISEA